MMESDSVCMWLNRPEPDWKQETDTTSVTRPCRCLLFTIRLSVKTGMLTSEALMAQSEPSSG